MILLEIRLQAKRLFPLYHFYKNVLELPITDDSPVHFTIHTSLSKLIFEKTEDPLSDPTYHFAFNVPSNRIQEAHDWLKERTELLWHEDYNSYIADFSSWKAYSVYFFDPGGNIVEFIARTDLKDIVDEPFSPQQIRNVSEIGLVFPEQTFRYSIEQLLKDYKLNFFSKQPPLEKFCAIGDDEGLFVAVPENKNWYPCKDKPARRFTMKISFADQNCLKKISFP